MLLKLEVDIQIQIKVRARKQKNPIWSSGGYFEKDIAENQYASTQMHWLSCTGCCQYLLNMKCLMYGLLFLQLSTPLFEKRIGLVYMDLLYIIFTILRIISRGVSGLTTDSPCGVWGHRKKTLASCVSFRFMFLKCQLVCKFHIVDRTFLLMFIFYYFLYTLPKCYLYYSSHIVSLWNIFFILSAKYYHFP